jgi:hypothetical protein
MGLQGQFLIIMLFVVNRLTMQRICFWALYVTPHVMKILMKVINK